MARVGSGLCYGPWPIYISALPHPSSSEQGTSACFNGASTGSIVLEMLHQRFGLCWFWDGGSFIVGLLGHLLQLVLLQAVWDQWEVKEPDGLQLWLLLQC